MSITELIKALEVLKVGLSKSAFFKQSNCFIFKTDTVNTYNDEFVLTKEIKTGIEGAVEAIPFLKYLKKCSEETRLVQKGNKLIVIDGKSRVKFNLIENVSIPTEQGLNECVWDSISSNFAEGLEFVYPTCSNTIGDALLNNVAVDGKNLIASDNYNIVSYELNHSLPKFLLPLKSARVLSKFKITNYLLTDNWVNFMTDSIFIRCRLLNEDFPNVKEHLEFDGVDFEFDDTIVSSIEKANVLAENFLTIKAKDVKLQIESDSIVGKFFEEFEVGEELEFNIKVNSKDFVNMLGKSRKVKISKAKLKFIGENWEYLMALHV